MCRILILLLALLTRSATMPMILNVLTTYQVFMPLVAQSQKPLGMGLAWATIEPYGVAVKADWWYRGGIFDDPSGTPSYPNLGSLYGASQCRAWMLIFNEPDPGGNLEWTYSPQDAAGQSRRVRQLCPTAQLIAGNVSQYGLDWLRQYVALGGEYDWLGFHCYTRWETEDCILQIQAFQSAFPNERLCLTEWNFVSHDPPTPSERYQFGLYLEFVQNNFSQCSAVFTDRYVDAGGNSNSLLNADGTLNQIGVIYAERNNH